MRQVGHSQELYRDAQSTKHINHANQVSTENSKEKDYLCLSTVSIDQPSMIQYYILQSDTHIHTLLEHIQFY